MEGKARHTATISLGVMGIGFAATLIFKGSAPAAFLQGGFEAGLVGGLADWFAVTALFRHPLGIPIPHTALLPNNRRKLTKALVDTVQNNLLDKESIGRRIGQLNIAGMLMDNLEGELGSESVRKAVVSASRQLLEQLKVEPLLPAIEAAIKRFAASENLAPLLRAAVGKAVAFGYEGKAFDFVLRKVSAWAETEQARQLLGSLGVRALSHMQVNGLMQFAVNAFLGFMTEEKLGDILRKALMSYTAELNENGHPHRESILAAIRKEAEALAADPRTAEQLNGWKNRMLDDWRLEEKLAAAAEDLKTRALRYIEEPEYAEQVAIPMLRRLFEALRSRPEALEGMDAWIKGKIVDLLEKHHAKIGQLVEDNIAKMDNETLIAMMEDKLGNDLQWIRVNGAICGFVIGLALTGIQYLS